MAHTDDLWFTRCPVPTATSVAADRGWLAAEFAPDGIAVRSLQDLDGAERRETHFTHAHETLLREGGNVPALWARSRGEPTRLIGLTWIEERQQILTRSDSSLHTAADLRGARLAIPRHADVMIDFWRAMALHGFAGALALAGLTPADATLVEIDGASHAGQWEAELAALAAGRVDAVYVKGAAAVEAAQRHGARTAIDLDAVPDRRARVNNGTPRPITVHQSLLDERPDLVARFLAQLLRAADWATDHPAQLARILSAETDAGDLGVSAAYRSHDLTVDLSPERLELLAVQESFLRAHGFLERRVDVDAWAAPEPLAAARRRLAEAGARIPTPKSPATAPTHTEVVA